MNFLAASTLHSTQNRRNMLVQTSLNGTKGTMGEEPIFALIMKCQFLSMSLGEYVCALFMAASISKAAMCYGLKSLSIISQRDFSKKEKRNESARSNECLLFDLSPLVCGARVNQLRRSRTKQIDSTTLLSDGLNVLKREPIVSVPPRRYRASTQTMPICR